MPTDWRDSSRKRWFGMLSILNRYVFRFAGWSLAYELDESTGQHVRWLWVRYRREAWS
jgi:hypothetical protein